jgi:hypothetical protein
MAAEAKCRSLRGKLLLGIANGLMIWGTTSLSDFFLQIVLVEFLLFGALKLATNSPEWLYFAIATDALVILLLIERSRYSWLSDWSFPNRARHQRQRDRSFRQGMRYVAMRRWPPEEDKSIGGSPQDLRRLPKPAPAR